MANLYSPYKAVGYVTDGNPLVVNRLGEETFLVSSVGKFFQVFKLDRLVVCLVSRQLPDHITSLQVFGHETFAAVGNLIYVFNRSAIVRKYEFHKAKIVGLVMVGRILVGFDELNCLSVIDTKSRQLVHSMELLQESQITGMVHPATYVNKFLVGYQNGELELWNINKRKLIYTYASHKTFLLEQIRSSGSTNNSYSVTSMQQSPACDVVAVGFSNGYILLMNLKLDSVLFSFCQESGEVSSISFRTDVASKEHPFMATSDREGRIYVWNLGTERRESVDGSVALERKLENVMEEAHCAEVTSLHFLHGEPILISSGRDNSIKIWIFDAPDGSARSLKAREGHSGVPTRIRYYGGSTNGSLRDNADGFSCELLSCGSDSTLRLFNTALENQNRELSQKPILKKLGLQRRNERLPAITDFDCCDTRERDWGNVVTIHKNHASVYLWKFRNRVITETVLRQQNWSSNELSHTPDRRTHATSVCLSPCGNYCIVGTRGGTVYMYNVQSGQPRGAFPVTAAEPTLKAGAVSKREATPANVFHAKKQLDKESAGGHANFLNPKILQNGDAPNTGITGSDAVVPNLASHGHTGAVTGVFVDMGNVCLTTIGMDGRVIFWDFHSHEFLACHEFPNSPLLRLQGFLDAGFVAVAGQDRSLRVFDTSSHKIVRRFAEGHSRQISDMAFTPDGRRLLSASLDSTLRVWDMPTGRCLSWLAFDAPILSLAISHSGEYLCLTQADKEGIYMYIDRSLYETVHFWQEPTFPTEIVGSLVRVEQSEAVEMEKGDGDADGDADDHDITDAVEAKKRSTVTPTQGQVETGLPKESSEQRGEGAITLSMVPRAYWTSLFHLEFIKERNKPKAPPSKPAQAPFFLPTVVKGGSTPSFPSPAEYKEMLVEKNKNNASNPMDSETKVHQDKKRLIESSGSALHNEADRLLKHQRKEETDRIAQELAAMSSTWDDDDDDDGASDNVEESGNDGFGDWGEDKTGAASVEDDKEPGLADGGEASRHEIVPHRSRSSRIINKKTSLPRCKMVLYLPDGEASSHWDADSSAELFEYLKTLPPPAVDAQFRSLCNSTDGNTDEEGRRLLKSLLDWFVVQLLGGENFELLQAYLHRLLVIFSDLISTKHEFGESLKRLQEVHTQSSERLSQFVHSNLCLLKVLSGLPPM